MAEEIEFEAYLSISPTKFGIYLHNLKNFQNLYSHEMKLGNLNDSIDLLMLSKFLDENIFKIEKLVGSFIKNVYLIINTKKSDNIKFGIKKKNYEKKIQKKHLENLILEANNLIKESYQNKKIIHILINHYLIDGKYYSKFINDINCDQLCLEVEFVFISNSFVADIGKVLEKYQIKVVKIFDENYIKNISNEHNREISELVHIIKEGFHENEVEVVHKNPKNEGFFEKFFQLFS